MNLVLDTSVLVQIERGDREVLRKLGELRKLYPAPPRIAFMSYFEFLFGLRRKNIKNKNKAMSLLGMFDVLHTTAKTANFLVLMKDKYALSLSDLFIASQVLESNGVLVTGDRDFEKIEEIDRIFI
jgi:predicted nucleic acid-binding protein